MNATKFLIRLFFIIAIPCCVGVATYSWMKGALLSPVDSNNTEKTLVEVRAGSLDALGTELTEKGLLKHAWVLKVLSKLSSKHSTSEIREGEYQLSPSMTPLEIIEKLTSPADERYLRTVIVPEGVSVNDLGKLFEKAGIVSAEAFQKELSDSARIRQLGIPADSYEGYFQPGRYQFSKLDPVQTFIAKMIDNSEQNWSEAEHEKKAEEVELSRHEVLTLASIVQKEASDPEDYASLASALQNRLQYGMKLESDETVIYGLKDFNGELTEEDKEQDHPYNTWLYYGLPAGPICIPSETAINAVLSAPKTNYLFWVKDLDGRLHFAADRKEFEELQKKVQ